MKKIVLFTGNELRHEFFRKYMALSNVIHVVKTFCEVTEGSLEKTMPNEVESPLRLQHLQLRRQSEIDFFSVFCEKTKDKSNPEWLAYGEINLPARVDEVMALKPDLIICYGASIIKSSLLDLYKNRFINIHLGLSPYYRGAGTNFWPFVNNEPEYAGVTFMHIDKGVDTGKIIHQLQAEMHAGDTIHQIGNRLIINMAKTCVQLVSQFDRLPQSPALDITILAEKVYRKNDFTEAAVETMCRNFDHGMVENYLADRKLGKRDISLVENVAFQYNMFNV